MRVNGWLWNCWSGGAIVGAADCWDWMWIVRAGWLLKL